MNSCRKQRTHTAVLMKRCTSLFMSVEKTFINKNRAEQLVQIQYIVLLLTNRMEPYRP